MATLLLELGAIVLALALLARLAARIGFSPIPLYLVAGLVMNAVVPTQLSTQAIAVESQVAVALLLFMLGLEYTGEDLAASLRAGRLAGVVDFILNFTPGFALALLLDWSLLAAVLLGGVSYISSSSIVAKVLDDLDRLGNAETPAILSVLVTEDLAMAVYLPLVSVALVGGGGVVSGSLSIIAAAATVALVLYVATRHGGHVSGLISHGSDEVLLLSVLGVLLVLAGVGELLHFSAAVGAFLLGIALSGPLVDRARAVIGPLRDLLAAVFFVLFGMQVDMAALPRWAGPALALAGVSMITKLLTGWFATRKVVSMPGRVRAGTALMPRGEFSIVIAGLALLGGVESGLGPLAVAYVLLTALLGPLATRLAGLLHVRPPSER
ncbi:MAG: cation:proton antiporter [Actinobacteria bacterium]|nr:cation:proton antiporter [Actinomycetota bacterium]